ncbi:N-acetylglucosamine-6-phosphate deacetylase [Thermoactinomyces mirandus]|uniref:N-acetylglucosamine-6-phosphate deacetylase n=1 Tax=Thermoactinomyces mirandus TaxID=2756294 RepID=A0A7W1XSR7_9BACL|nr:N-acetylglucosamine-6-phosphate deacetylase [Thermoactinomyces mirandus]MBA4602594.1 N-acetylglucosamine-6-phosphate deacetylase [Thermoactinomyces mirandus]
MEQNRLLTLMNGRIYAEQETIQNGYLQMSDKLIAVGEMSEFVQHPDEDVIDLQGRTVIPGMIDMHIHGVAGVDVMDAVPEALERMSVYLAREGTTGFLATTITQSPDRIAKAISNVAHYMENSQTAGKAECLGIHLEGPFVSPKRKGAQPLEFIMEPDVSQFQLWQEAARGKIKLVTLAPEEPGGAELARYLRETGVIASIGHSDATYDQVMEGVEAGVSHVTHLFNGMRGFHHREPGVAGAAMLNETLNVEMILDGIHIDPRSVILAYQQITSERILLITDAMRAKCMKEGVYDLGGQQVTVNERDARLADGTLAGSILKMKDAASNIKKFTGCSMEDIIKMTASNAAKELDIYDRKGSIAVGKDADLVVLNQDFDVHMTFCRGKIAYHSDRKELE